MRNLSLLVMIVVVVVSEIATMRTLVAHTQGGEDEFGFQTTLFDLDSTAGLTSATLNVNLTGGQIYLLLVQKAFFSFGLETTEVPVTITIGEAAQ